MNYMEALEGANADAEDFVLAGGVATCPIKTTGLIVVAYREDTNEVIPGAGVTVGTDWIRADEQGQAKFLPTIAGPKHIKVSAPLTSETRGLGDTEIDMRVMQGSCAVCPVGLPIWAHPEIKLAWLGDGTGVAGVKVELSGGGAIHTFPALTKSDGVAAWKADGIKPGPYDCSFTFAGGVKYLVHDGGGTALDKVTVTLGPRDAPFTFKIRKSWVKLAVACEKVGELDAELKLKAIAAPIKLEKGRGVVEVKDVAVVGKALTCEIESFAPDGDGVYELVEVVTT
jgi:hypothetical protein